jgi:hypothetical protein
MAPRELLPAVRTALVVGIVLTLIHDPRIFVGHMEGRSLLRAALNFVVPFLVASYSRFTLMRELSARDRAAGENRPSSPVA